jgi:hypothetical protein
MRLALRSLPLRLALIAVESAAFIALTLWAGKVYLADVISRRVTIENLRLASRLDPGNSDYHLKMGRLYQYSLTDINPDLAIQELSRAAELSPMDAQPWLDLGAAQEVAGHIDEASVSLRRADYLAPTQPGIQWAIANFFLLHGDTREAMRHFKVVLAGTGQFNEIIFNTAWKAIGNGNEILASLIPDIPDTEIRYMDYLIHKGQLPDAQGVWERFVSEHQTFDPSLAAYYMDVLMGTGHPDQAYKVWSDLESHHLVSEPAEPGNLLSNGDFESELRNIGFGWRLYSAQGVYIGIDTTVFHSGGHSMVISFSGSSGNLFYEGLQHWVKVTPGVAYQARAYMKTEDITTDSGPRLWVHDPVKPAVFNKYSDQLVGSNAGWTLLTIDFTPKADFVTVAVARVPSQKLDNVISGRVWVDDVSVVKASSARSDGEP